MQKISAIQDLSSRFNEALKKENFKGEPISLYEPINYMMSIGGKRMRPVLLLLACELSGGDINKAMSAAIGIELFHNFTLLHDDIMDNAPLRRGKPTVHSIYNTDTAILAGDVTFVISCQYLSRVENAISAKVMNIFYDTAIKVCEGQQLDMIFGESAQVSLEAYLNMIRLKTAVLLGGSLKIGALIGGASDDVADNLYHIGVNMGIAFQLQDDILDTFGDPEKFGKKPGGDIVQNKKTFLLLKALETADIHQKQELEKWILSKNNDSEKVSAITRIYQSLGVKNEAARVRDKYYKDAVDRLASLPVPEDKKLLLKNFGLALLMREH